MAGYAKRFVTLHFPELSEDGDDVHIVLRNPKLMAPSELRRRDVALGPDGEPEDMNDAMQASYEVMAKLVIGWHVYDATSTDDEQPLLGLPATGHSVGKLPMEIVTAIGQQLGKVNPPTPTASPEESTSTS